MRSSIASLTLLLTVAGGCGYSAQPDPELHRVCRADESADCVDWALAGETVALELAGRNLTAAWEVDLGDDDPPAAIGTFRAWIGGHELEQVELAMDAAGTQPHLRGRLPAGPVPGLHPAEVETPAGQRAAVGSAFALRSPLSLEVVGEPARLPRGATFQILVRLTHAGTVPLEQVALSLRQGGDGSFYLPPPPAPFTIAGGEQATVQLELEAASPGRPEIEVAATALAAGRVPVSSGAPQRWRAEILEPARLAVEAVAEPATVAVDDPFSLRIIVGNDGGTTAEAVRPLRPQAEGNGAVRWQLDSSQMRDIPPGGQATFTWDGIGANPGTARIQAAVAGTEALSDRPLQAASATAELTITP